MTDPTPAEKALAAALLVVTEYHPQALLSQTEGRYWTQDRIAAAILAHLRANPDLARAVAAELLTEEALGPSLKVALRVHWYADRPLADPRGRNLDDVLAEDARIILAALRGAS